MSSSMTDLDDIYEEFLALTSSSSVEFSPEAASLSPTLRPESYDHVPQDPPAEDMSLQWRIPAQGHSQYWPPWIYNRDNLYNRFESSMTPPPPPPPPDVKPATTLFQYPSGIDVVFKQVPSECRALLVPSDVQDSATRRGYFTVGELLELKRLLISRYTGEPRVPTVLDRSKLGGATSRRGLKRSHEVQPVVVESEKVSVIRSTSGVGGVVMEAMTILDDQGVGSCHSNQRK